MLIGAVHVGSTQPLEMLASEADLELEIRGGSFFAKPLENPHPLFFDVSSIKVLLSLKYPPLSSYASQLLTFDKWV